MAENILHIENLEFGYPDRGALLKIQDLSLARGERLFLYGESGSGKTTLLGLIAGVLQNQKGHIRILNQDLTMMSDSSRDIFRGSHLGYIFQLFNLIPYLSVLDNIGLAAEMNSTRRGRLKKSIREEAARLATNLGLHGQINALVTELSVGQQQRVAVARALIGNPELIIADEPTSALDADHRQKFIQILFQQCEASGASLIFVSHDKSLESQFSRSLSISELNRGPH